MAVSDSATSVFAPSPVSGRQARAWLSGLLKEWGYDTTVGDSVVDDALLCAAELATNVVLHSRSPFELFVRRTGARLQLEVIDDRPAELPLPVPLDGTAADITKNGTTGRGLQIVAALARRWGVTTSQHAKAVWAELEPGTSAVPTEPVVVIGHRDPPASNPVHLEFLSLPVRAAVASGVQVDDLVRELQLSIGVIGPPSGERDRLHALLDESAHARLTGRHAALRAAARGDRWFDLSVDTSVESLRAVSKLGELLASIAPTLPAGVAPLSDDVIAFRRWLDEEGASQRKGYPPRPCPLPA